MFDIYKVTLIGRSPISFSRDWRAISDPEIYAKVNKIKEETDGARKVDELFWREKAHYDSSDADKQLYIPANMLHPTLVAAASYDAGKIAGKGSKTWTQKFRSGVSIANNGLLFIGDAKVTFSNIGCEEWLCEAQPGKRNSGKVLRRFPITKDPGPATHEKWNAMFRIAVRDPIINLATLYKHLFIAGCYIGLGRRRPERGGPLGTFSVGSIELRLKESETQGGEAWRQLEMKKLERELEAANRKEAEKEAA